MEKGELKENMVGNHGNLRQSNDNVKRTETIRRVKNEVKGKIE